MLKNKSRGKRQPRQRQRKYQHNGQLKGNSTKAPVPLAWHVNEAEKQKKMKQVPISPNGDRKLFDEWREYQTNVKARTTTALALAKETRTPHHLEIAAAMHQHDKKLEAILKQWGKEGGYLQEDNSVEQTESKEKQNKSTKIRIARKERRRIMYEEKMEQKNDKKLAKEAEKIERKVMRVEAEKSKQKEIDPVAEVTQKSGKKRARDNYNHVELPMVKKKKKDKRNQSDISGNNTKGKKRKHDEDDDPDEGDKPTKKQKRNKDKASQKSNPADMKCGKCAQFGHVAKTCPLTVCSVCGRNGHKKKHCPRRKALKKDVK